MSAAVRAASVRPLPAHISEAKGNVAHSCDNKCGTGKRVNAIRSLTRSLDSTEEGLVVETTRKQYASKDCQRCGATFVEPPNRGPKAFAARRYCSQACSRAAQVVDFTQRLWARIAVGGEDECWLWQGATIKNGYGVIGKPGGNSAGNILTHVAVYKERVGSIPPGYQVDHLCRVTACCNPRHLEAVTQAENLRRQAAALKAARTHCSHGHAWAEHGAPTRGGGRYCRTCNRINSTERYRARKALRADARERAQS